MNSQAFIKYAAQAIRDINDQRTLESIGSGIGGDQRQRIQKEVNQLFAGLQNPTLPSAYRLRDAAHAAGYQVDSRVLQRLAQHEEL